ncbi:MAG: hypothetical protein IJP31_01200 [Lachnospiraceae bacterium]|nr:hypothetical protein [Lachnospiraceae bacterium]
MADYRLLNHDYFGAEAMEWFTETIDIHIAERAEEVKGEFQEVIPTDSFFPKELMIRLEKIIYQSLDAEMEKYLYSGQTYLPPYMEQMAALEVEPVKIGEMTQLFPQLKNEEIEDDLFEAYRLVTGYESVSDLIQISWRGENNVFVCVRDHGGSNGAQAVSIEQWNGEEFVTLDEFDTQNYGWGKVINYGGEYYYIFWQYNYSLKNYDGIRIHRLGEKSAEQTVLIKYLPHDYIWENLYDGTKTTSLKDELADYLSSVQAELISLTYLEQGQEGCSVFVGDEETIHRDENERYTKTWYKTDFTNTGIPVYLEKSSFSPSDRRSIWHLRTYFYLIDSYDNTVYELDKIGTGTELPRENMPVLVQLWFREFSGKVYTFSLYHVSDYSYLLNVSLIEGDSITRIRTDILLPERHFTLSNDIFVNGY